MKTRIACPHVAALALTAALAACSGAKEAATRDTAHTTRDSANGSIGAAGQRDTSYGPKNALGRIPVLEYHVIAAKEGQYTVTKEHLLKDLQLAYDRGYRPITIAQMLDKDFSPVPSGMSPIVFVFDDASDSQFRYIEKDGKLEIDPTSAVGIWLDFAKTHPGWKNRGTFCMLNGGAAGHNFFGDSPKYG